VVIHYGSYWLGFTIGIVIGWFLWRYNRSTKASTFSALHNNARDEILLCSLTGVKCGNRLRICKLKFGKCSGQRKISPIT